MREGITDPKSPEKSDSRVFRRELFDIVIFDPDARELRINARSKRDHDLYVRAFGAFLADDEDAFPDVDKYTLQPLIDSGASALECADIGGIREIKLLEFTVGLGGAYKESFTREATDLFATKWIKEHGIPTFGNLFRARFEVYFSKSKASRKVSIIVPNKAKYKRDTDGDVIEQWLCAANFITAPSPAPESDEPIGAASVA
ncbi:MAG: hypothetical protein ACREIA_10810 [Opitutaceae bacterium]